VRTHFLKKQLHGKACPVWCSGLSQNFAASGDVRRIFLRCGVNVVDKHSSWDNNPTQVGISPLARRRNPFLALL
jgi:hypothetical protein